MMVPNMPTPEERTRHEVYHMPYAAWCRSCVAGRGKADEHFLKTSDDSGVKGVACDYGLKQNSAEGDAIRDRWVTARVVPQKGPEGYAVKATAVDLQQSGMCSFLCKSDGGNEIKPLKQRAVQQLRETVGPVDVIFEESRAAESQQHATNERAIWEQSTARTLVHV